MSVDAGYCLLPDKNFFLPIQSVNCLQARFKPSRFEVPGPHEASELEEELGPLVSEQLRQAFGETLSWRS